MLTLGLIVSVRHYNIKIADSTPSVGGQAYSQGTQQGYIHDEVTLRQKTIRVSGRLAVALAFRHYGEAR